MWDSVADMGILVSAILAVVPLIILPNFLFYFDITPKVVIFLLGTAIAAPLGAKSLQVLWKERLGRWLCILLATQAASLTLGTTLSTNPGLSLTGTNWRRFGLVTQIALVIFTALVTAYAAGDRERVRQLLRVVSISGIPVAAYGVLQYFGWDPWIPKQAYHIGEGIWTIVRPPGTLGYANYFATYLTTMIFASVGLAMIEQDRIWKGAAVVAVFLGSIAVVFSGTRGAMLGLIVGGALLLFSMRRGVRLSLVSVVVAMALLFYFSPAGQNLRSRAKWSIEDPRGGARPELWRDSTRMAVQRWWVGTGLETFSGNFPRFQSRELARAYPDFYHESPHNIFLDAFAAQGALGLAALAGLNALGFYAGWQGRTKDAAFSGALSAALGAELVSGQFVSFTLPTALFFYVTVALLVAMRLKVTAGSSPRPGGALPTTHKATNCWSAGSHARPGNARLESGKRIILFSSVAFSAALVAFAIQLLLYDRALAKTNRLIRSNNIVQAASEYQRVQKWRLPGASADLWYSRAMAAHKAWSESLRAAMEAPQRAEDPQNAWYNLAAFYATENDAARTEQSLRSAISCAPNWFKPHWTLARMLAAAGRLREAEAEAAVAADLDGGKNPEVASTLAEIRAAGK